MYHCLSRVEKNQQKRPTFVDCAHADFVKNDSEPILLHAVKKHFKIDMEGIRTSSLMQLQQVRKLR